MQHGMRDLKQVLLDLGVTTVAGWTLLEAERISDDGTVIIGRATPSGGGGNRAFAAVIPAVCYADCNGSGSLTVADFACFQTKFVAGDPYADCTGNAALTIADFRCFQTAFVAGCP